MELPWRKPEGRSGIFRLDTFKNLAYSGWFLQIAYPTFNWSLHQNRVLQAYNLLYPLSRGTQRRKSPPQNLRYQQMMFPMRSFRITGAITVCRYPWCVELDSRYTTLVYTLFWLSWLMGTASFLLWAWMKRQKQTVNRRDRNLADN